MNDSEMYTRKYTPKELLTFTYNKVLQRVVDYKLDVAFYKEKASQYKKRSNEYNAEMQNHLNAQSSLNNNELTLKVIEKQIAEYEAEEVKQ